MSPFTHAVASFDPTQDAVLLWTRAVDVAQVTWVLARDPGLQDVVADGSAAVSAGCDWAVTVDATGLEPGTTYWYSFGAGAAQSPVGRTRTLPGPGAAEAVVGLVCCADYSVAPMTVYRALAQREVDVVVHLGDYVYESAGKHGRRDHEPPHPVRTLADYRARIGQMRTDPDCQALHLRHPVVVVVDDHDLADNAWRGGAKAHDEDEDGPWAARALAAMTARDEWVPGRGADALRTWRALPLGDLAELVLLDSRLHGRDLQASEPGALPLEAEERTILGADQRDWSLERLADTRRPWSLLVNGVVVNEIVLRPPAPQLLAPLMPEGYVVHDGVLMRDDQWDGYPAERRRLVEAMARRRAAGGETLLLSGDVHSSWAFDGPRDAAGVPVTVEAVTPSVSSAPMGRTRLPAVWRVLDRAVQRLEHVRFVDITNRGFTVVHVRAHEVLVGWHWADPYDPADVPTVTTACWLAVTRGAEPGWLPAAPQEPLADRGAVAVPARPDDVLAARRLHQRRRAAGLAAVTAVPLAAAAGLVRRLRR